MPPEQGVHFLAGGVVLDDELIKVRIGLACAEIIEAEDECVEGDRVGWVGVD